MGLKDKKTNITFHAGVLSIGGTIIEIEYEGARVFFDFGSEYRPEIELKTESYQELLDHELIPPLDQVYDSRLSFEERGDYQDVAVFLSHCHLDHTRVINFVDPAIPVFTLKETKVLLNSLNRYGDFLLPGLDKKQTRDLIGLNHRDVIQIKDIKVTVHRVDHDAYGACGLFIETPDLTIAYTGDIRLHGFDKEDSIDFCQFVKGCDVLIIEGVSISFDDSREIEHETEQVLIDKFVEILKQNPDKQISFNTYPSNVKRLVELIKRSPRQVVCEASYAHVLKKTLDFDTYYYVSQEVYEELNPEYLLEYSEVLNDPENYLVQITRQHEDLQGGGIYIHSDASPLGEFDPAYLPFIEKLEKQGVHFMRVACSGHAYPQDLDLIVEMIEPKLLVPIHSYHPERLENKLGERHLPTRKETL